MFRGKALNLQEKKVFNHHSNLPNPFRMLIVGPSGSNKTTLALSVLLQPSFVDYNNLVIFTPNPQTKDEYQFLFHGYNNKLSQDDLANIWLDQDSIREYSLPIPNVCQMLASLKEKDGALHGDTTVSLSDKIHEIPQPEELNKIYGKRNHTIIFDDCARANKKTMEVYFTESRHAHCNCIYIAHDFFSLPNDVRINSNIIIMFEQDPRKLSNIYSNTIGERIMERDKFIYLSNNIWSKPNGYVVINKASKRVTDDMFEGI